MKIIISTSLLSPYRVDWFSELGKYADVSVFYLHDKDKDREDEWLKKHTEKCNFFYMKGVNIPKIGKVSFDFIKEIKNQKYDIIILDGYGYYTQIINIRFLNKKKIKYFVNFDGIVNTTKNGLKAKLKNKLILSFPYYLCGSLTAKNYILSLGGEESRIFNHNFTSLYNSDIYTEIAGKIEKADLRVKNGITEKYMIISVGRFTYLNGYGKGYDVVLKAAKSLTKEIGWYIIGGQPTNEFKKLKEDNNLDNVHFIDFKTKEELKDFYRAADIFVLMTIGDVWGLVINEAMACGLPVITTDKCIAGIELIGNGTNGYIVPVGDHEMLAERISEILAQNRVEEMGKRSIEKIKDYTIEQMAQRHINLFEQLKDET